MLSLIREKSHLLSFSVKSQFRCFSGYCKEGFLLLQDAISKAYIEHFTTSVLPFVQFQRFPYPPYVDDPILPALTAFISTIILLSYVYPAINTIRAVAVEKESKMKVRNALIYVILPD